MNYLDLLGLHQLRYYLTARSGLARLKNILSTGVFLILIGFLGDLKSVSELGEDESWSSAEYSLFFFNKERGPFDLWRFRLHQFEFEFDEFVDGFIFIVRWTLYVNN